MPYISVHVDADEVLEDLSLDELAAYLVRQSGWEEELNKAMDKRMVASGYMDGSSPEADLKAILEAARFGGDVGHAMRLAADRHFGWVM